VTLKSHRDFKTFLGLWPAIENYQALATKQAMSRSVLNEA
jgi:hypothetical protein